VEGKSTVSFFAKQAGSTQLNAFSIDGRKVVGINQNLQEGLNSFQLSLPKGAFSIQVVGKGYTYTAKMINQTGTVRKPEIAYSGTVKQATSNPQKSKSSALGTTTMTYTTGDQLLYKGTSGNYSTIVTDVPTASKTINFDFVTCQDTDLNNYSVVTIGTQTWMVENLKTTRYRNGEAIGTTTPVTKDIYSENMPKYQWAYNGDENMAAKYGRLYTWYAATDSRNIAPVSWHVPTDAEWTTLENYVSANLGTSGSVAKSLAATTDWDSFLNTGAIGNDLTKNNTSGFTALPGGYRYSEGFLGVGDTGYWWRSTGNDTTDAWFFRGLHCSDGGLARGYYTESSGFSVRCVRDDVSILYIPTVNIPAGMFIMGSPESEVNRNTDDETQYPVTLTAFRMSKYEITNAQYAAFLNAKGIGITNDTYGLYTGGAYPTQPIIYSPGSYLHYSGSQWIPVAGYETSPVVNVTWYGATEYATYVGGSLPTEAQWEYGCRAGTTTPFNTGSCLTNTQASYDWSYPYSTCTNTVTTYPGKTLPVGSYAPNAYGLYDMHGNVWEWCSDWYGTTYPTTAQTNPTGPATGSFRAIRGGGWNDYAQFCRSAIRGNFHPDGYYDSFGLRVVFVP